MFHRLLCPFFLLLYLSLLSGCVDRSRESSALFEKIFLADAQSMKNDPSTFRGTILGDQIERALSQEAVSPVHQDKLGLSYEFLLEEEIRMFVDYYSDNLKGGQPSNRIISIVANIRMEDEVETARLYNEMESYLNLKYGVANGGYGGFTWNAFTLHTNNMEVRLKLNDDKRSITLNFIDIQPQQFSIDNSLEDSLLNIP